MQKKVAFVRLVITFFIFGNACCSYAQDHKAVIVKSDAPKLNKGISKELKNAGYTVIELDQQELSDKLLAEKADLVVLSNSAALPFGAIDVIQKYLEGAGDIIALNTPIWQDSYDNWFKFSKKTVPLMPQVMDNILCTPENMNKWGHNFFDGHLTWQKENSHELVKNLSGPANNALYVTVPEVTVWNTFNSPQLQKPFKEGHTLTVFYAKGSERTNQLHFEWQEEDGSLWWASVSLTQEWQQYVLTPEDFHLHWWSGKPTTGKTFNPQNAAAFKIGLFNAHVANLDEGRHEYWLGPVGTAKKQDEGKLLSPYELPFMDTLSPWYNHFNCDDVAKIYPCRDQKLINIDSIPFAKTIRSPHQRASGNGFDKKRNWRWIPLLEAASSGGQWRGSPATLLLHSDGKYKGGIWASFAIGDIEWYSSPQVLKAIGQLAKRMSDGVFMMDGGSNFFTYFDDQDVMVGTRLINLGKEKKSKITARVTVENSKTGKQIEQFNWPVDLDPGQEINVSDKIKIQDWPKKGLKVTAELSRDGKVFDRIAHDTYVWKAKPKDKRSYITIKDGDFFLNGKRWRAKGINYMPSSGVATKDLDYTYYWFSPQTYDPEIIKRDLEHVKDMNFNSVRVFIFHHEVPAQNLLDLLRRCEELNLKVDLFMRPGTPMDFEWEKMKEILQYYRIAENDTVFALDLAWEPAWPRHDGRKKWDAQWQDWIVERYGSIANAEKDWQFALPVEDGNATNPLDQHVTTDGPWYKMTAAYRRFLDTVLYENYERARRLVRTIDPYHHVSFSMDRSGDATTRALAYDWPYLSAAVDMLEPEAYNRIGDWETVKKCWFTFEYGRWAAPKKPLMWVEMGDSAFDLDLLQSTNTMMQKQAEFYGHFYRVLISSGTDGFFPWYYPSGFRTDERSDFGIINPDGTDRPVSKMLRNKGSAFFKGPSAKPINHWIEIDRDKHCDGIYGIYEEVAQEFWKAIESGKSPGFRTDATDTNSANCPLLAVGNTNYDGNNPPKFLDGFFDVVEIKDANGKWVNVKKGSEIEVAPGEVIAKVTLTNLCEPLWLSPVDYSGPGGISIQVEKLGKTTLTPLPRSVQHLETVVIPELKITDEQLKEPVTVTMTLLAKDRAKFGPRYSFQIKIAGHNK